MLYSALLSLRRYALCAMAIAQPGTMAAVNAGPVDVLRATNADLNRFALDNGMVGIVKHDASAPIVTVQIWVRTGSVHEGAYTGGGLSHYLEHMLFKGTTNRSASEVTKAIDEVGGSINAYTTYERTVYHNTLPAEHWRVGLDVLADMMMNATFPVDEWEREREVVFREVAMGRDDPDRVLSKLIFDTAYQVHPFQHPVIGHDDVLQTMTRDELIAYYRERYVPQNMFTVVVGDIDPPEVEQAIRDTFADWPRQPRAPIVLPREPSQASPRTARKTGPVQLTRIEWAYPTVGLSHPDAAALDAIATIVGRGRSARIVKHLVEDLRIAVEASAWSYTPQDPGIFGISATCEPDREQEVLAAIEAQVADWRTRPFTEDELARAKRRLLVRELNGLKTAGGLANAYGLGEFYAADPRYGESYLEQVNRLTTDDLARVAARWLLPEARNLAILSPETDVAIAASPDTAPTASFAELPLPNGIRLLVREDHRLPFVSVSTASRGGLLAETRENNGITQLMANLLVRGTPTRSADQVATEVDALGAQLTPFSGRNTFGLQARFLSEDTESMLTLLAECLLEPTFPRDEIDKQRALQLADRASKEEQPMFLARENMMEALFPGHPYAWDPVGTRDALDRIAAEDLVHHFQRLLSGTNLVIAVCGDITTTTASNLVTAAFAGVPAAAATPNLPRRANPELPSRIVREEPREQAIVLKGFPGITVDDPRAEALDILQTAVSGLASELMIEIRDKRGLAYYAGGSNLPGLVPGVFFLYCGTRADVVEEVDGLMDQEVDRLRSGALRDDEISRARSKLITRADTLLQNNFQVAQSIALDALYGLDPGRVFTARERLENTSDDDVRAAAREILNPRQMATAVLIPVPGQTL